MDIKQNCVCSCVCVCVWSILLSLNTDTILFVLFYFFSVNTAISSNDLIRFRVNSNFRLNIAVKKENLSATLQSLHCEANQQQELMKFPALTHGFSSPHAIQATLQLHSQATHKLLLHTKENTARTASELVTLLSQMMFISQLGKWVGTKQSWDEHNWKRFRSSDLRSVVFKLEHTEESQSTLVKNTDSHLSPQKFTYTGPDKGRGQADAFLKMSPGDLMQIIHEDSGLQSVVPKPSASASPVN